MEILWKERCKVRKHSKSKDWEEERNHKEGVVVDHVGLWYCQDLGFYSE